MKFVNGRRSGTCLPKATSKSSLPHLDIPQGALSNPPVQTSITDFSSALPVPCLWVAKVFLMRGLLLYEHLLSRTHGCTLHSPDRQRVSEQDPDSIKRIKRASFLVQIISAVKDLRICLQLHKCCLFCSRQGSLKHHKQAARAQRVAPFLPEY